MENELLKVLIMGLAVWRLSSLFSREKGPFDVFVNIRKLIYRGTVYTGIVGKIFRTLNDGINCMWCNSIWFSIAVYFLPLWVAMILALSTIAILIERLNGESIY